MKNIFIYLIIFLFLSTSVKAIELEEGRTYEGTLSNVFSSSFSFTLPPGKWTLNDISLENTWYYAYLLNSKDDGRLYLTFPEVKSASDYYIGGGLKKCRSETLNDRVIKVLADQIKRGGVQSKFCIQEVTWTPSNDKELNILLDLMKSSSSPIYHIIYSLYYPINKSNISSVSNNDLKKIGLKLMEEFRKNSKGMSADFSDISMLIKTPSKNNNSVSSSGTSSNVNKLETASDNFVCRKSSSLDGMKWENMDSKFGDYVTEAFRRNLSLKECRQLTGRKPSDIKKSTEPKILMDIKNRLKELKSMLDDGLINQDQYDAKSTELLKDF